MPMQAVKLSATPSSWYASAMERLVNVVEELSRTRDLDAIMGIVRRAARELTGADGATFVLRDGDKCFYAEENAITPLWKGQRFPLTSCVSGWTMLNRSAAVIEDIYADPRIPADAYRPTFVKSLAMVPIRMEDPVGAIGNYWAEKRLPTEEEVAILQALANVTAVAIENVELYRRLQEQVRELEAKNDELTRFAWVASHDLKSPLRAISNLSHWAEDDAGTALPDQSRQHLKSLRSRVQRMDKLLNDLLRYSMAAEVHDEGEVASGKDILAAVLGTVDLPPRFTVTADAVANNARLPRFEMERILSNLIDNAAKHHDLEAGTIRICAEEMEDKYVFSVIDDGPGIPKDACERVFEIFQTLKPRDKMEGSGMGLAIVRRILKAHGDEIRVTSEGRGSAFIFTWRKSLGLPK